MKLDPDSPRTRWAWACYLEWKDAKPKQFFAHFAGCPNVTVTKNARCGAQVSNALCFERRNAPEFEDVLALVVLPAGMLALIFAVAFGKPHDSCWLQCAQPIGS